MELLGWESRCRASVDGKYLSLAMKSSSLRPVAKTRRKKPALKVCLISAHGFFLNQFQNLLSGAGYYPQVQHLEGKLSGGDLNAFSVPRASVYVFDAQSAPQFANAAVAQILEQNPKAQLIVLTDQFDETAAFPLLRVGAKGLLNYSEATTQLPRALEAVSTGGYWVPRALLSRFVDAILHEGRSGHPRPAVSKKLSRREQEILDSLLTNLSNKEIANKLNISERTVKFHVSNLLSKYGVQRRADLILLAFQTHMPAIPGQSRPM
jgi:DNA-binding NarL/FixJ family response regulator